MVNTREQIVDAAEVLFAENGYNGTSLRQITERAGANIAAVNYHFGSKENLLIEILDRVVVPINARRLVLLDHLERQGTPDIRQVLEAFLLPDLRTLKELRQRNPALPRFVARMYSENTELMRPIMGQQFETIGRRFGSAIATALPNLSAEEIGWRLQCIVGIVIYLFASITLPGASSMVGDNTEADVERLLAITVPMMTAPSREAATR